MSKTKEELERDQELKDIAHVANTPQGKRFLRYFFKKGMIFQSTFTGNSHTYYNEGKRGLALEILADLQEAASRDTVAEIMIKEELN